MKRCKFLVCFALVLVLVMPLRVEAAEQDNLLYLTDGNRIASYEHDTNGSGIHIGRSPVYFVFTDLGFYMCTYKADTGISYTELCIYASSGSWGEIDTYTSRTSKGELIGYTWDYLYFVAWGDSFGSSTYGTYTVNSEEELLALCDQDSTVGSFYKLYDTEATYYVDKVDFFQKPPVTGVLEKKLTTVLQTMEVNPLTEVLKILPIGLVCWVGWIGLRKGLSLLRTVLFPA